MPIFINYTEGIHIPEFKKGVLFLDNSRMLQRNGRLVNLSAYNTIPRYNRSDSRCDSDCGCNAQTYNMNIREDAGCSCKKEKVCDECGYGYNTANDNCGCKNDNRNIPLAISSIGVQKWCDIYDLEQGFRAGTIFRQLDLPFCGAKGGRL